MTGSKVIVVGVFCLASASVLALTTAGEPAASRTPPARGWWQARGKIAVPMRPQAARGAMAPAATPQQVPSEAQKLSDFLEGQRLFEVETFGGNGRTCLTCHSRETGTVSPADARRRFLADSQDPLFVHDGSDDDNGDGFGDGAHVTRMLANATVLMRIALHDDVSVKDHPEIREVTVPRGIPTTLNTPALDPVLMLDGRQPTLQAQALGAITQHAQPTLVVTARELDLIARSSADPHVLQLAVARGFRVRRSARPGTSARADGVRTAGPALLRRRPARFQRRSAEFQARRLRHLPQRPDAEPDQSIPATRGSAGNALSIGAGVGVQRGG